jgi:hypothetical protein
MRGKYYALSMEFHGLGKKDVIECFFLICDIWRADGDIPAASASNAFTAICEQNGISYQSLFKAGLIPHWPFSPSSGEVVA